MKRQLNILVACEESQAVCRAFRDLGHNAYSCDLFKCSGTKFGTDEAEPHPEWHFDHDITTVLDKTNLTLQNGEQAIIHGDWDIMIGHPPCTFLAVSGAKWMYHPADKGLPIEERRPHPSFPNRKQDQEDGAKFFLFLASAAVKRIAIENPVGIMSSRWRKPDQNIQPYMFGDPYSKNTCLWLKNLHPLHPSKETDDHGERIYFESGKSQPKWYSDGLTKTKTKEERQKWRSKTFPGIARGIAEQWTIQIAAEENIFDEEEWNVLGKDYLKLLDDMTGGIRYSSAKVNKELEKRKYPVHFKKDLLDEIESREQALISYWKNK
ncbi:hypothetical protein [Leyella stercorea]|uniref:hypothetical protein n=1 Tax=Leyella stercorea TaxID=363265 RepID=UPI00242AAE8B|nr:hypothetical protein [Leyella stercorea]